MLTISRIMLDMILISFNFIMDVNSLSSQGHRRALRGASRDVSVARSQELCQEEAQPERGRALHDLISFNSFKSYLIIFN